MIVGDQWTDVCTSPEQECLQCNEYDLSQQTINYHGIVGLSK